MSEALAFMSSDVSDDLGLWIGARTLNRRHFSQMGGGLPKSQLLKILHNKLIELRRFRAPLAGFARPRKNLHTPSNGRSCLRQSSQTLTENPDLNAEPEYLSPDPVISRAHGVQKDPATPLIMVTRTILYCDNTERLHSSCGCNDSGDHTTRAHSSTVAYGRLGRDHQFVQSWKRLIMHNSDVFVCPVRL